MEEQRTARGFPLVEFKDYYNVPCLIQMSSLATEEAIWFGCNSDKLVVFADNLGPYIEMTMPKNFQVKDRMHLTRDQVAKILPYLQRFVETGNIIEE